MSYQQLDQYKGSLTGQPHYSGIEFDFEVPDNIVTASPGGVSAIQHHPSHGMYSESSSYWDIYAGEERRYPYAEHGNVYNVGHSAPQHLGEYGLPVLDPMYTQNQSSPHIDNFKAIPGTIGETPVNIEYLAPPDSAEVKAAGAVLTSDFKKLTHNIHFPNPWLLFFLFVLAYFAMDFWVNAGESFVIEKFHGGKSPSWMWYAFYAAVVTFIIFLITSSFEVPLLSLEQI